MVMLVKASRLSKQFFYLPFFKNTADKAVIPMPIILTENANRDGKT